MEQPEKPKESWETDIRSDLWTRMNAHQLNVQREIILTKITLLHSMTGYNETAVNILMSLEMVLKDVDELILRTPEIKKQRERIVM